VELVVEQNEQFHLTHPATSCKERHACRDPVASQNDSGCFVHKIQKAAQPASSFCLLPDYTDRQSVRDGIFLQKVELAQLLLQQLHDYWGHTPLNHLHLSLLSIDGLVLLNVLQNAKG
jgi:hypothetical protein